MARKLYSKLWLLLRRTALSGEGMVKGKKRKEWGKGEKEKRVSITAQYIKGIIPLSASTGERVGGSNWPELCS